MFDALRTARHVPHADKPQRAAADRCRRGGRASCAFILRGRRKGGGTSG
jgi:hypothetical protein